MSHVAVTVHHVLLLPHSCLLQAGHLPFVDVVRVQSGQATAVNIIDGEESEFVSARANGFLSILKDFQHKVSLSA